MKIKTFSYPYYYPGLHHQDAKKNRKRKNMHIITTNKEPSVQVSLRKQHRFSLGKEKLGMEMLTRRKQKEGQSTEEKLKMQICLLKILRSRWFVSGSLANVHTVLNYNAIDR